MGMRLLMSTSFHSQMDGTTERANRSIGQIFRAMIGPDQLDWVEKSPLIEFAINSSISSTMGLALFEINGRYMPVMMKEVKDNERTPLGIRSFVQTTIRNIALADDTLIEAWVFQKAHTDKRWHNEPEIKEDDLVYLSMKNISMPKGRASKLVPKYIGPYRVMKAIPSTSNYELELPMELIHRRIHPRFHMSLLRPHNQMMTTCS
jgi:hypothetical protein